MDLFVYFDYYYITVLISVIVSIVYFIVKKYVLKKLSDFVDVIIFFCVIQYFQTLYWFSLGISGGIGNGNIRMTPNYIPIVGLVEVFSMGVESMIMQAIWNVILFIPFGVLLPLVSTYFRSFAKITIFAIATSVLVETLQYFSERSADIDDVIMNLIGGIIGYSIYLFIFHVRERNKNENIK